MTLPFVSVIVPFYNIESCVDYCLGSLLAQDYEGEYEILCVDDGSTDKTSSILDKYAALNSKISVIHKENGGLSDARNFGVKHAKGEYITFVDGDDVVSPYYLSTLVDALNLDEESMVFSVLLDISAKKVNSISWDKPKRTVKIDKASLMREICFQRIMTSSCGGLANKSIYLNHPAPVGHLYEDTYMVGEYVSQVSSFSIVYTPIYGYVARMGSIVHPKNEKINKCVQRIESIERFCAFLGDSYPPESDEAVFFRSIEYSRLWRHLDEVADCPDEAKEQQLRIQSYVKQHLKQIKTCSEVSKGNKARFSMLAKNPKLYRIAFSMYDRMFKGI